MVKISWLTSSYCNRYHDHRRFFGWLIWIDTINKKDIQETGFKNVTNVAEEM